ncbi:MAG: hypothetical protein M0T84_12500, partial [Betaproteobacteria bacterium]|nr:hypothetical protein [Betaproteobacteria bacterium]
NVLPGLPCKLDNGALRHRHAVFRVGEFGVAKSGGIWVAIGEFRRLGTFHVLVNPGDPAVRAVLRKMVEQRSYFVLVVDPGQHVTAFKAEVDEAALSGLADHNGRLERSTTSSVQYDKVRRQFSRRPQAPGTMMAWACRGGLAYLDLSQDRMELSPSPVVSAAQPPAEESDEDGDCNPEPVHHPIAMLPAIAEMTADELQGAMDLYRSLERARDCPHVLGDAEIERAIRLCGNQLEMVPVYRAQAERCETLTHAQRQVLGQLETDIEEFENVVNATLVLAKEMAPGTIDSILRMDEGELGLAVFEGRQPPPSGPPLREALRVKESRAIAAMLDAAVASLPPHCEPLEFLAAVGPQLPLFYRLVELCDADEVNVLCAEFGGLFRFAKTLEQIAAGIRSGTIRVPH